MTVTNERTLNESLEDKPRQGNTKIWLKPGKNPKMGKTLGQFILLSNIKCSAEYESTIRLKQTVKDRLCPIQRSTIDKVAPSQSPEEG